ncbi:MAG: response regulator [Geobacter sp.]|nr:response regulator [Geobacter sp.]
MQKVLITSAAQLFLNRNLELLRRRGLQLCSVTRGEDAIKLHKKYRFDLILSDMVLEEMDGCTLCNRILKDDNVPVVIICHNTPANIEKVETSGARSFILKPVNPVQLMEVVGSFVELQESKSQRVTLNVPVLSKTPDDEFFCRAHNISNTGMLLASEYQLALGKRIICNFTLPDSTEIETKGEIVRSVSTFESKTLYGVKFVEHPPFHQHAIHSYVSSIAGLIANA